MRRAFTLIVLLGFAAGITAPEAFSHGGIMRGPMGGGTTRGPGNPGKPTRPKNPGKTKDRPAETPPPTDPTSPPTTPAEPPATPTTPSSPDSTPPSAPTTPRLPGPVSGPVTGPTAPSGPPAAGPSAVAGRTGGAGGASRRTPQASERWETWWGHTCELYLGRHRTNALPATPQPTFAAGRSGPAPTQSLLSDEVRKSLLPLLAQALRDSSVEVADSAAIALGRSLPRADAAPLLPHLMKNLAHPERSPQEAAILGLGLVGGPETVAALREIALDAPEGRRRCGATGPIDDLLRGFATLGLGLAGTQDALSPIVTLATSATASRELAATAVVAMGLQREAAPAAIVTLSRLLDERGLDRMVRAQVPIAMARLPTAASRGMLPKLLAALTDKQTPDEVARSIALSMGQLATLDDGEAARVLMDVARRHADASTREFALIALGRIGERGARAEGDDSAQRQPVHTFLLEQVLHPERKMQQPFAALAVGLFGRGEATSPAARARVALSSRKLIETFETARDPSLQGALALALGLLRSDSAGPVLSARLAETRDPALLGQLAVALGMVGARDAVAPLRDLLEDSALLPTTRIDVARGLALLDDRDFEGQLLDLLAAAPDSWSASAYVRALGLVGGSDAAPALRAMVEDRELPEIQRGFAVVAIGLLAERSELPWNVPYLVDANFTLPLRPLDAILELL